MTEGRVKLQRRERRAAFSLLELLVVMGIIGLLISILAPVIGAAREASRRTKCMDNLRQIGLAMDAYLIDSKGRWPVQVGAGNADGSGIADFANPQVYSGTNLGHQTVLASLISEIGANYNEIYSCPDATVHPLSTMFEVTTRWSSTNYLPNAAVVGRWINGTYFGRKATDIPHPSDVILFQEHFYLYGCSFPSPLPNISSGAIPLYSQWASYQYCSLHPAMIGNLAGGNVLFVDGHCEFRYFNSLHASDFGLASYSGQFPGNANDAVSTMLYGGQTNYTSIFD